MGDFLDVTS